MRLSSIIFFVFILSWSCQLYALALGPSERKIAEEGVVKNPEMLIQEELTSAWDTFLDEKEGKITLSDGMIFLQSHGYDFRHMKGSHIVLEREGAGHVSLTSNMSSKALIDIMTRSLTWKSRNKKKSSQKSPDVPIERHRRTTEEDPKKIRRQQMVQETLLAKKAKRAEMLKAEAEETEEENSEPEITPRTLSAHQQVVDHLEGLVNTMQQTAETQPAESMATQQESFKQSIISINATNPERTNQELVTLDLTKFILGSELNNLGIYFFSEAAKISEAPEFKPEKEELLKKSLKMLVFTLELIKDEPSFLNITNRVIRNIAFIHETLGMLYFNIDDFNQIIDRITCSQRQDLSHYPEWQVLNKAEEHYLLALQNYEKSCMVLGDDELKTKQEFLNSQLAFVVIAQAKRLQLQELSLPNRNQKKKKVKEILEILKKYEHTIKNNKGAKEAPVLFNYLSAEAHEDFADLFEEEDIKRIQIEKIASLIQYYAKSFAYYMEIISADTNENEKIIDHKNKLRGKIARLLNVLADRCCFKNQEQSIRFCEKAIELLKDIQESQGENSVKYKELLAQSYFSIAIAQALPKKTIDRRVDAQRMEAASKNFIEALRTDPGYEEAKKIYKIFLTNPASFKSLMALNMQRNPGEEISAEIERKVFGTIATMKCA